MLFHTKDTYSKGYFYRMFYDTTFFVYYDFHLQGLGVSLWSMDEDKLLRHRNVNTNDSINYR